MTELSVDDDQPVAALRLVTRWILEGQALRGDDAAATLRLRVFLDVLDHVPVWRHKVAGLCARLIVSRSALPLFEAGLPNDRGLLDETSDRLARRLLPAVRDQTDLGEALGELFPRASDCEWIAQLPPELLGRVDALFRSTRADVFAGVRQAAIDAVALVATRTSALGLSREMRARSPGEALAASPFYLLPRLCDALFAGIGSAASCRTQLGACEHVLETVTAHLEEYGVSVDVVYRIDVISTNLHRLSDLLEVLDTPEPEERAVTAAALLARMLAARVRDRSLRDVLRTNLRLLAQKIIDRAGETGEHYITATRKEYVGMLLSAAGGGFLTVGTTYFKYLTAWAHFPLFVEGAVSSSNYALSFLAMQLLGMTLATKQPSMTAPALAAALKTGGERADLDELVTLIARICRSQLAAAIGNVGMAIPSALAMHFLYLKVVGHPFFDPHAAAHTLESLDPFHTGTIAFAALTGVLLWLSSLGAGWLENWAVYRRLPEAIAQHRAGRIFGTRFMSWLSRKFAHHVAGVGGNCSLGALLGMVPVFGKFLGLPLEVRHVTLSTCGLTLAAAAIGPEVLHHGLLPAAAGIAIIGTLNFGVSFVLALGVALRARAVERSGGRLLSALARRFFRSPFEFVFPPSA
jgi:site-specific recombinase